MSKDTQTTTLPVGNVAFAPRPKGLTEEEFVHRMGEPIRVPLTPHRPIPDSTVSAIEAIAKLLSTQAFDSKESDTLTAKALELVAKL